MRDAGGDFRLHDARYRLRIITGRLHKPEIFGVQGEFQHSAMMLIASCLIEEVRLQSIVRHDIRKEEHACKAADHQQTEASEHDFQRETPPGQAKAAGKPHDHGGERDSKQDLIADLIGIGSGNIGGGRNAAKIHRDQRPALEFLDVHVGYAKQEQNGTDRENADPRAAAQGKHQQIEQQIDHVIRQNILVSGKEAGDEIAVQTLHGDHHHQWRHKEEKHQIDGPGKLRLVPSQGNTRPYQKRCSKTEIEERDTPALQDQEFLILHGQEGKQQKGKHSANPNRYS